ncbi:hypothetical protein BST36_23260 [Mycolicibacterium moriokaense]|uniref:Uncharacterized protein n=1 Tax=Mycolicibacterium moriokaense TaxID=39691 RepID=A0AAD1M4H6_9MYCO|nr:hypothetical protein [Mycolicibacterium moriokaense]ORB18516.1 hypothetical protein BST36_23260 [Mycolicibacterium moriokaense]BBX00108.1 hypothetical protein MMOR_10440 [Mycolicibacterium moriokaense]
MGAFRARLLDVGPCTFMAADALVLEVGEGGWVVDVHAMMATAVLPRLSGNPWVSMSPPPGTGRGRSLTARGLSGVRLLASDAHAGVLAVIGARCPVRPGSAAETTTRRI